MASSSDILSMLNGASTEAALRPARERSGDTLSTSGRSFDLLSGLRELPGAGAKNWQAVKDRAQAQANVRTLRPEIQRDVIGKGPEQGQKGHSAKVLPFDRLPQPAVADKTATQQEYGVGSTRGKEFVPGPDVWNPPTFRR